MCHKEESGLEQLPVATELSRDVHESGDYKVLQELVQKSADMLNSHDPDSDLIRFREKAKSHAMCALLLRDKRDPDERLIAVGCSHLFFHAEADFWRQLQTLTAKISLHQLACSTDNPKTGVSVFFCADMNSDPPSPAVNSMLQRNGGLVLHSAYPVTEAQLKAESNINVDKDFTNWVGSFCCMIDYIMFGHVGWNEPSQNGSKIELKALAKLHDKNTITKECLATDSLGETDHTLVQIPEDMDSKNIYALPNAHFPSDHVSLIADFQFLKK
ncbi:Lethal(3)malignant brain tumor-like protein 1 [Cichlidogyrus casuarinus]|uniref:Lethal(3)malignant brain tumor-like protein 1 n=1 Tax=Cichlidogyrus casuarinus TaxID=1844966 RepID=A0ABD2QIQ6_9PLAT